MMTTTTMMMRWWFSSSASDARCVCKYTTEYRNTCCWRDTGSKNRNKRLGAADRAVWILAQHYGDTCKCRQDSVDTGTTLWRYMQMPTGQCGYWHNTMAIHANADRTVWILAQHYGDTCKCRPDSVDTGTTLWRYMQKGGASRIEHDS
jgi:hypothetical protein